MKKSVFITLVCLFSIVLVFSAYKIISALKAYREAEETYSSVEEEYKSEVETEEVTKPTSEKEESSEDETVVPVVYEDYSAYEHPTKLSLLNVPFDYILMPKYAFDFESLQEMNPEVTAWIRIEGTKIDYPVVQGDDNSKYLRVGADGNPLNAGSIFIDYRNVEPFNDKVTIIYGHNQRNHAIFHDLLGYREESYFTDHPFVEIYLPDGSALKYQVFAAGLIDAVGSNYRIFFGSDDDYMDFLQKCVNNSEVNFNVDLTADDKIILLSTCTNDYNDDYRMVVYARKISTD